LTEDDDFPKIRRDKHSVKIDNSGIITLESKQIPFKDFIPNGNYASEKYFKDFLFSKDIRDKFSLEKKFIESYILDLKKKYKDKSEWSDISYQDDDGENKTCKYTEYLAIQQEKLNKIFNDFQEEVKK